MAWRWLLAATGRRGWWHAAPSGTPLFAAEQRATLVNVKLKWVKDRVLDAAVSRERHLRTAHHLLDLVFSRPGHRISRSDLLAEKSARRLCGSAYSLLEFLSRYHTIFALSRGGVSPTDVAFDLRQREVDCLFATEDDLVARLRRLLMLTLPRSLPLHTVDLLRWDLGLPSDYRASILPRTTSPLSSPRETSASGSASSPGTIFSPFPSLRRALTGAIPPASPSR